MSGGLYQLSASCYWWEGGGAATCHAKVGVHYSRRGGGEGEQIEMVGMWDKKEK